MFKKLIEILSYLSISTYVSAARYDYDEAYEYGDYVASDGDSGFFWLVVIGLVIYFFSKKD